MNIYQGKLRTESKQACKIVQENQRMEMRLRHKVAEIYVWDNLKLCE